MPGMGESDIDYSVNSFITRYHAKAVSKTPATTSVTER